MTDEAEQTPGTGLALIPTKVLSALEQGKIKDWSALVKEVAAPALPVVVGAIPKPAVINDDEKKALAKLPEVYGSVVPVERRELVPHEVSDLLKERAVLKEVEGLIKRRLEDISLTVNNSNSSNYEAHAEEADAAAGAILGPDGKPWVTDKGHVVRAAKIPGDDDSLTEEFSIETRKGSITCDPATLDALGDDDEHDFIDHKDYLSMTSQVRVFDEHKAMIAVRKKPELLQAVRLAAKTGAPSVSVYVRKK